MSINTIKSSLTWDALGVELDPWLKDAIRSMGFPTMTPVQAATIPLFCGNKDVVVEAVTGSGKTIAFAIPLLQKLTQTLREDGNIPRGKFFGIIISPTRELANQTERVLQSILKFQPELGIPKNCQDDENVSSSGPQIRTQLLVGSLSSVRDDVDSFLKNRPHILVGTPGRLLDFLGVASIKTGACEMAILDEADNLLDIGFEQTVVSILSKLPKQRRTGLFSATISSAGNTIFRTGMSNPVKVAVSSSKKEQNAPAALTISYMMVNPEFKLLTTLSLLQEYQFKKAIIYFPTCAAVKHFYNFLQYYLKEKDLQLKFYSLHGQLSTKARIRALNNFADADINGQFAKHVLMTTDVAARGIDIPDVDLVIQIDPPTNPENFLHRSGRTGRANKVGQAIVMLNDGDSKEDGYIDFMAVKGLQMKEIIAPEIEPNHDLITKFRQFILQDRARHELGLKAYVGFVKYYSKHQASSIFRMALLDYVAIAKMYGLLRIPKMPETRYIPAEKMPEDGWLGEVIDMDKYAYMDENREKSRIENLEQEKNQKIDEAKKRKELKKKNEAWSGKIETKEQKGLRREKMKRKREAIEKQIMQESSADEEEEQDWKEMVRTNKKKKANNNNVQGSFDDL